MCGIVFTNKEIDNINQIIKYLQKRGPDHTEHKEINGYSFIHLLLSMTGKSLTIQPFVYNNIVIMFNGEIYNYNDFGDFNSDGECIIESYKKHGDNFIKFLDGEFAILLVDFEKNVLYYSTDIFSTKPLWISIDNKHIGICSYESSLKELNFTNIKQVQPNTTVKINLINYTILTEQTVYDFDLNQHKLNYDDWNSAFENAIKKRVSNIKHGVFIGLSAGYDSGLIACVLTKLGYDFKAYSIIGSENPSILKQRHSLLKNGEIIDISREDFMNQRKFLKENSEEYCLKIENGERQSYIKSLMQLDKLNIDKKNLLAQNKFNPTTHKLWIDSYTNILSLSKHYLRTYKFRMREQMVTDDNGSIGLSHISMKARTEGNIIYLSGSGADEIISDYGYNSIKHYGHSSIGGFFPTNLKSVFPWKNFFDNTQRAYLMKEETVSGTHGVEGRYPFLDKFVVQEFLWLSNDLKNKNYKSVIYNYLIKEKYPFEKDKKVGFGCGFAGPDIDLDKSFTKIQIHNHQYTPVGTDKKLQVDINFDKECETYIIKNDIDFTFLFDNIK